MINCSICKFEVSTKMRHALNKNMCPACGSALLGDFHMQRLNLIREKLSAQDFSRELNQNVIFDLSMFIMSEFFNSSPNRSESLAKEEDSKDSDVDDLASIRRQVERDVFKENFSIKDSELEEEYSDDEDPELKDMIAALSYGETDRSLDLKAAKLKRLYNESPIIKEETRPTSIKRDKISVRRVT
jgi:Zn-finger nucleic acid-binding protein